MLKKLGIEIDRNEQRRGYGIGSVSRAKRVHSKESADHNKPAQVIHHSQQPTQKTSMAKEKPRFDVLRVMSASKPIP